MKKKVISKLRTLTRAQRLGLRFRRHQRRRRQERRSAVGEQARA